MHDDIDRSTLNVVIAAMGEKQRRQAGSLLNANHSLVRSMSLHGVPRANERASERASGVRNAV